MKKALLALAVLVSGAAVAEAQVRNRWRLEYSNEKPQLYTYRSPNDRYENYWYVVFTIENRTEDIVPVIVDHLLYTETGKELQRDLQKVDSATIKSERDAPRKAEGLKFGRFYANVVNPEVEFRIIEHHARLGNRSEGIARESVEALKKGFTADPPDQFKGKWKKGDRLYLNPRELREHRYLQPGQKLMGLATFQDVDPRANVYELHVSGLVDIIKITAVTEDEWKMEYEPHTLKLHWERRGDEFEIENDVLWSFPRREYVVKKIGPIAAKDTVDRLVKALADTLRKEKEWKEQNLAAAEVAKRRAQDGIDVLDTRIMAGVVQLATGRDFGYEPGKDVIENEKAVWRIHEWWIINATKLVFNEGTNRFEIKEDPLPGTVPEK